VSMIFTYNVIVMVKVKVSYGPQLSSAFEDIQNVKCEDTNAKKLGNVADERVILFSAISSSDNLRLGI